MPLTPNYSQASTSPKDDLFRPYQPDNFDDFWRETLEEVNGAQLDFTRGDKNIYRLQGFFVNSLDFRGIKGNKLYGWIAIPEEGGEPIPAFLWIPPYGREGSIPNPYTTRPGFVSLSFNLHGFPAFYRESYEPSRGYFAQGISDPHTWVFREIAQNCMLAIRALAAQPEADETRIGAMGISQGGGIALWLSWLSSYIRVVAADLPFLAAMREVFNKKIYRYPLKEVTDYMDSHSLDKEIVLRTISYFDTVNHASKIEIPVQISYGKKDPACKPENVRAIYDALQCEKRLIVYEGGHDYDSSMITNNLEWFKAHL
ncbi:MAG TPA: acetylxylan esterase [Fimbriimonadales bacterium]|nr:acetylxylan esterase [Fimbriimonadales bacterium]